MRRNLILICIAALALNCGGGNEPNNKPTPDGGSTSVKSVTSDLCWNIFSGKAMYAPGETIRFTTDGTLTSDTHIRYRQGTKVISDELLTATEWTWTAPAEDGKGYLVEVYRMKNDSTEQIIGTHGIDVSSDWHLFPRYGFVATFDASKSESVIETEMAYLNRCHINGVQFQDWHYKHHWPAPVDKNGNLLNSFTDIANRTNSTKVIKDYIRVQHGYGMKSIFYNLCYGVLDDAAEDGVRPEWYLFKDGNHSSKDSHVLPSSWKSDIYLVDPANADWHEYIKARNTEVYTHFDFDGFQIDQLGYRGNRYTYSGQPINFNKAYASFINAMKQAHPDKDLIMNAVGSYGAQAIMETGNVMAAYNECWDDEKEFSNLRSIVKANETYSKGSAKTIFACYMNYSCDNRAFNVPGVLLTDAVMFALGGSHLELGDHMLCREYFPYTGVYMTDALREQIIRYYDFMTAYENLLRGGGAEEALAVTSDGSKNVSINQWPPKIGKITTFGRLQDGKHVLHLLNFTNANSTSWRDIDGSMPAPRVVKELPLSVSVSDKIEHVYVASPDYHGGALVELSFTQKDGVVSFTLPAIKYWDMIVLE